MNKEEPEYRVVQKSAAVQAVVSAIVFVGGCYLTAKCHNGYFSGRWMAWIGALWFGASVVQFNVAYWTRRHL